MLCLLEPPCIDLVCPGNSQRLGLSQEVAGGLGAWVLGSVQLCRQLASPPFFGPQGLSRGRRVGLKALPMCPVQGSQRLHQQSGVNTAHQRAWVQVLVVPVQAIH